VHAGGKIEALGTGGFGAPKSFSDDLGVNAAEVNGGGESGPMVTVETVCVVDIRENQPPDDIMGNPLEKEGMMTNKTMQTTGGGGGSGNNHGNTSHSHDNNNSNTGPSPFAAHNLPGVKKDDKKSSTKTTEVANKSTKKARKKGEERLARMERERKKQAKMIQMQIDRENRAKESNWSGRAGGMEVSRSLEEMPRRGKGKNASMDALPPVKRPGSSGGGDEQLMRSNSAPGNNRTTGGMRISNNLQDSPLMRSVGPRS